jgi:hypothetical protein
LSEQVLEKQTTCISPCLLIIECRWVIKLIHTHTHTHTHIYIYIYIYMELVSLQLQNLKYTCSIYMVYSDIQLMVFTVPWFKTLSLRSSKKF